MSSLHCAACIHTHTHRAKSPPFGLWCVHTYLRGGKTLCATCVCVCVAAAASRFINRTAAVRSTETCCGGGDRWKESLFLRPVAATSQPTSRPAQPRQPPRAVDGPGPGHGRRWMLSHNAHTHTRTRTDQKPAATRRRATASARASSLPANIRERARVHHEPHDAHARPLPYTLYARERLRARARVSFISRFPPFFFFFYYRTSAPVSVLPVERART